MVEIIQNDGKHLSKLIASSSTDVRKISEIIITYVVIKSCYNGRDSTSLVKLCDVIEELVDFTDKSTCVQQIRHGRYISVYFMFILFIWVN